MRAAIMQPTYMPWIGYFAMVQSVDTFVFFDDVQFIRRGFDHRNRIKNLNNSVAMWISVPVEHSGKMDISFIDAKIKNDNSWKEKHKNAIYHSYCKAKYFSKYWPVIESVYNKEYEDLAQLNIETIEVLSELLRIDKPKFIRSSELGDISGRKTERLIEILKKIDADEYLSPIGSKIYIDNEMFINNEISLDYLDFEHSRYSQLGSGFITHLSVLDLLFNMGEQSIQYINECLKKSIKTEIAKGDVS